LARDRNLRYQTAAAFHRDLNRFLNRQYPDFSPQDFSVFIKSIFAEDILSLRKRLVDYSKIGSDAGNFDEKTSGSETQTNSLVLTQTGPQGLSLKTSSVNVRPPAVIKNENGSTTPQATTQDTGVPAASGQPGRAVLDDAMITRETNRKIDVQPKIEYQLEDHDESSYSRNTNSRVTRYTQSRIRKSKDKPSIRVSTLALFLFAVVGIYSYLVKFHTSVMNPVIHMTHPVLGKLHEALGVGGTIERASTASQPPPRHVAPSPAVAVTPAPVEANEPADTFAVISSEPSGAAILLDGKDTGMITPSRVTVPAARPFRFQLKRLGYREFVRADMTYQQLGSHFTAKLKEVDYAYLDIDIIRQRMHGSISMEP